MADRIGQQFGDYRLTRFLGRGSFGDVYLGEHVQDKTLAAVKVLQARLTNEDLKEFINETSTVFRMKHPPCFTARHSPALPSMPVDCDFSHANQ